MVAGSIVVPSLTTLLERVERGVVDAQTAAVGQHRGLRHDGAVRAVAVDDGAPLA